MARGTRNRRRVQEPYGAGAPLAYRAPRSHPGQALGELRKGCARDHRRGENLERQWAEHTLEWWRTVIGTAVESITINPSAVHGRREFDPSAITVKWKL